MAKPANSDKEAPKPQQPLLALAQAWLPILTVVGGAAWGLWTYLEDQKAARAAASVQADAARVAAAAQADKENRTRIIEAQKPFLDKQLLLYFEAAQVAGRLVQVPKTNPQWTGDRDRFWELYWAELAMVEHRPVESAMVRFGAELKLIENAAPDADRSALQSAALGLAHALRDGVQSSWGTPQSDIVAK